MSLGLQEKVKIVEEISTEIANANLVIIAGYSGLNVPSFTLLRKIARGSNVYLRVIKNSLACRAFSGTNFEFLSSQVVGALVYGISSDPVSAAKVFVNFAKNNASLVVKAGSLYNKLLNVSDIEDLALIPSYEELLSKLLRTMQAPISQFLGTLNEIPGGFVRGLSLICEKKKVAVFE